MNMDIIYLLQCQDRLKVGFTSQPFSQYLEWIRGRIPFEVRPLKYRRGTREEEVEFHHEHKEFLCGWGGREWYFDSPELRQEALEFLTLPEAPEAFQSASPEQHAAQSSHGDVL